MRTFPPFDLPEELVLEVAGQCRTRDLARFTCTSTNSHRLGQLALYRRLSDISIYRIFE
ncbi:hypothetical protein BDW74DRAFT_158695 [Aspergillus multicolor]|uniref:uncharacterized protein n=1 Tax=Aspergillus multicolor TaxID=41759 RepID=UPI003CCCA215